MADRSNADYDRLFRKLGNDTIGSDELLELRRVVNSMSDDELDALLRRLVPSDDTCHDCFGRDDIPDDAIARVKQAVDARIDEEEEALHPRRVAQWRRMAVGIAAALLPLFIATTAWLYLRGHEAAPSGNITIASTDGTDITLVDGSRVSLNRNSRMDVASTFSRAHRTVDFSGEGYFEIAADSLHPFEIHTGDLDVRVLGTAFSLSAPADASVATVSLYDGRVELTAVATSETVTITPGMRAVFDAGARKFTVDSMPDRQLPYWVSSHISYTDISPDSLVASVETIYNVTLDPAVTNAINERFTGTLPTDNFSRAMSILSRIYGFPLPYNSGR